MGGGGEGNSNNRLRIMGDWRTLNCRPGFTSSPLPILIFLPLSSARISFTLLTSTSTPSQAIELDMANAETSLAASQAGKPLPTLRYSSSRPSLKKPSPPPTATTGAAGSRIKPGVPEKERSEEVIGNEPPSLAGAAAVARVRRMLGEVGKEEETAGVPHRPSGGVEELPPTAHASPPLSPVAAMTKAVMGRAKLDADPVAVLSRVRRPGCCHDPPPSPPHLDCRTPPSIAIHTLSYPRPPFRCLWDKASAPCPTSCPHAES